MTEAVGFATRDAWLVGRKRYIGASEAPALLGIHPYMTAYELFMRKTGVLESEKSAPEIREDSIHLPPMERGNFFEEKAIDLARMLRPDWEITSNPMPGGRVFADQEARMSSTPDAIIALPSGERATLQIKSVEAFAFKQKWNDNGEICAPLWIACQAMQDAHLTGADRAFVGAMVVSYNVDFYLLEVPLHQGVLDKIRNAVAEFWGRVALNDPPPPDYAKDGEIIARLYAESTDAETDLSGNPRISELVDLRDALKAREKDGNAASKERAIIDAEILDALGNCERGRLADGRVIIAKTVYRKPYPVAASSYRPIRIK